MIFAVIRHDKPNSLALRKSERPEHLKYLETVLDKIVYGGALLDAQGGQDGSVLIIVDDVSPLTTWAGVLGLIAALLGLIGMLATLTQVPTGNTRIVGLVVGVVAGVGLGLLLQEMAILDPANALDLLFPGGGAVLGFLIPGILRRQPTAAA